MARISALLAVFGTLIASISTAVVPAALPLTAAAPVAYNAAPLVAGGGRRPRPVACSCARRRGSGAPLSPPGCRPVAAVAPVAYSAPVVAARTAEDVDANPQYTFAYSVQDGITGDSKAQEESRDGDVVRGSYSLIEPDGVRRTVSYYADSINGFNAVVQRDVPVVAAAAPVAVAPAKVVAAV
ncbi:Hypothetical predicted protein [Cloeon dipterum]|uniref:Larval cuticle protein A2B n=1 Tax=Cloeon dipterum TaxID=197152 RepID=A0A8S1CTV3_9INSE|nr:Hypothetical predicted protein [Cloeon dipterum]